MSETRIVAHDDADPRRLPTQATVRPFSLPPQPAKVLSGDVEEVRSSVADVGFEDDIDVDADASSGLLVPDRPPVWQSVGRIEPLAAALTPSRPGATYLAKSSQLRAIKPAKLVEHSSLETEVRYLRERTACGYEKMIGESPAMKHVFETLKRLESVDAPTVLISGESGTGKDLVAQAIHARGPRKNRPYMEIDCAAMPETLIESELFGHEKGSFTDARATKKGLFEVAAGGVIFLDEIREMSAGTQAKLLRALENRKFKRVGGTVDIHLDAAVVAATNRDLRAEVRAGRFREDLFFRLNVVPIEIPPLRDRTQDVEAITLALVARTAKDLGRDIPGVAADALEALRAYSWPGNVRELRNVIERTVILKQFDNVIQLEELPDEVRCAKTSSTVTCPYQLLPEGIDLAGVERGLVEQALERSNGNRTQAAKLLGISRFAVRHRIHKYGISDKSDAEAPRFDGKLAVGAP